jgi:acyl-CoA synthetase (AMP-forming)/AMP-acid ligase II
VAANFARRLEAASRRALDKPALVWEGGALTFGELDRRATAFAETLAAGGVKAGDRLALSIGNHWAFAVALVAGWKLGATVAPLDALLKDEERAGILADLAPAALVDQADVTSVAAGPARRARR